MSFADMIQEEMELSGQSRDEVRDLMKEIPPARDVKGTTGDGVESVTGYTGHDAAKTVITTRIIMLYQAMK